MAARRNGSSAHPTPNRGARAPVAIRSSRPSHLPCPAGRLNASADEVPMVCASAIAASGNRSLPFPSPRSLYLYLHARLRPWSSPYPSSISCPCLCLPPCPCPCPCPCLGPCPPPTPIRAAERWIASPPEHAENTPVISRFSLGPLTRSILPRGQFPIDFQGTARFTWQRRVDLPFGLQGCSRVPRLECSSIEHSTFRRTFWLLPVRGAGTPHPGGSGFHWRSYGWE
jgi:hypothetical protein